MQGLHFLRELVRNLACVQVEEFLSLCQGHVGIRPYAVVTDIAPESILCELSADAYWGYLARRAWLFQLHGQDGGLRTVSWQEFSDLMPQAERDSFTFLTTENFWPITELFVWLFHGPAFGGFTIDAGHETPLYEEVIDTPVGVIAKRAKKSFAGKSESASVDWYYTSISQYPLIPKETEQKLAALVRIGDTYARNALVLANLRFAASIARYYQNRGLPLQDIIQAANIGLLKAAERFDHTRGFKFISYAVWWVRQSILQAIAEGGRTVTLPMNRVGRIVKLRKMSQLLEQRLGREVTSADIADALGVSVKDIEADLISAQNASSFDAPLKGRDGEDGDSNLFDLICDPRAVRPARVILDRGAREEINRALSTLDDRYAEVLDKYYGINYETAMTLEEIGEHYSLTRERIRQIKEKALMRLRHHSRAKTLFAYFQKLEGKQ